MLITLQVKINQFYNSLLKDNFPHFCEYFNSRILSKPYLRKILKYVSEYVCIFEKHIGENYSQILYYDVDKGIKIPSKYKFS